MCQRPCEQDAYPNKETPQHTVNLTNVFWMGNYEITKQQWVTVMGIAPWEGRKYVQNDTLTPAVYISYRDAITFVGKLSAITGRTFRNDSCWSILLFHNGAPP